MITILKSEGRGATETSWLDSRHSFSFGEFFDPERMGFRSLRVLNDDRIAAGKGFPMHGHREMEIVSYVVQGAMEHKDSLGNGSVIRHGEVQRMSAGTGMQHSEWNPSTAQSLHLVQVWLLPNESGVVPSYEQREFDLGAASRGWVVLAAPQNGLVTIRCDAVIATTIASTGQVRSLEFDAGRAGYLFVARGSVRFHGNELNPGDAAQIEEERSLGLTALTECELLAFDLA